MKKCFFIAVGFLISGVVMFISCSKSSSGPDKETGDFDKTAMLTYYADSIIIPGYTTLQQKINALQTAIDAFTTAPSSSTQLSVKMAYEGAHTQYVRMEPFNFGPAGTALLDVYVNFTGGLDYNFNTAGELTGFSIDSVTIENNIASGTYNLTTYSRNSFYSQGFPALNYLLFGPNAIAKFNTNTANRVKYVKDIVARLKTLFDKVASDWITYHPGFIVNTQTNIGSPIGNMINQLAYEMDILKGPRIGWPLGKQSNGIQFPGKCEAYFAGFSIALAIENLNALKNIYTANGSGKGFSDYLVALGKTSLNSDVLAQFDLTLTKLQAVVDPLSVRLAGSGADIALINAAYIEIQKLLTLIKTDVASATAVQITFMDNDGD